MTRMNLLMANVAEAAKQYGDVDAALASARHRRRLGRAAVLASATVAVASILLGLSFSIPGNKATTIASKPPSPVTELFPASCVANSLPLPTGVAYSSITAGDPTGRFIAGQLDPGDDRRRRPVFWVDGQAQLPSPPGEDPAFTDINSQGTAVGSSTIRNTKGQLVTTAWHFQNGKFTTLKGLNPTARAINEQGIIVGTVDMSPARWRDANAEPEILDVPAGIAGPLTVTGVDEDGSMLATPRVLWHADGTPSLLPSGFGGVAIRHRWLSGRSSQTGARLNLRTGQLEMLDGNLLGLFSVISANGWVAGQSKDDKLRLAIPSRHLELLPPSRGLPAKGKPVFISDDGRTVGGLFEEEFGPNREYRAIAVVWRCT